MPVEPLNPVIDSILESIKKLLGLAREHDSFDQDILININTVFSTLTQMGVGPEEGFSITGYDEEWSEFVTSDPLKTQQIRSYIYLNVKTMFDPSANSNIAAALDKVIAELGFRLYAEEENARYTQTLTEEEDSLDE